MQFDSATLRHFYCAMAVNVAFRAVSSRSMAATRSNASAIEPGGHRPIHQHEHPYAFRPVPRVRFCDDFACGPWPERTKAALSSAWFSGTANNRLKNLIRRGLGAISSGLRVHASIAGLLTMPECCTEKLASPPTHEQRSGAPSAAFSFPQPVENTRRISNQHNRRTLPRIICAAPGFWPVVTLASD